MSLFALPSLSLCLPIEPISPLNNQTRDLVPSVWGSGPKKLVHAMTQERSVSSTHDASRGNRNHDQEKGGNPLDLSLDDMAISSAKEHLTPRRLASLKHLDHLFELLCFQPFYRRLRHHAAVHADSA
jgi:hypothetical protein